MKDKQKLIAVFLTLVGVSILLSACRCGLAPETVIIQGKVSVAGSEPFTYVRLITPEAEPFKLVGPKAALLRRDYQGRSVKLGGKVVQQARGPGFPAEFEVFQIF